jgi:antitoxin (DNA-binding transcriptional repressor) of toxin-antitoxin stability system
MQIGATEFQKQCLQLMSQVEQTREEVVIIKDGKAIAKLVPLETSTPKSIIGYLKDTVIISDDLITPTGEMWEVSLPA